MDTTARVAEVLAATGFLFARCELEKISQRQATLAFFYPFGCDSFRDAVLHLRQDLWSRESAPFPFDVTHPSRDRWGISRLLDYASGDAGVRWVMGEGDDPES